MDRKRIAAYLLTLVMVFALTACGGDLPAADDTNLTADELQEKIDGQIRQINEVMDGHGALWDGLFAQEEGAGGQVYAGSAISAYLQTLLDKYGDTLEDSDRKALDGDMEKIRGLEAELEALEAQYEKLQGGDAEAEPFPAFSGKDLDGNAVDSQSLFSGNTVTVVNFWFNTCPSCLAEMEDLNALHRQLQEKGGAVVGVNTDTLDGDEGQIAEAKRILEEKGTVYQNVWFASDSEAGQFAGQILGFPTTYVVDGQGRIVGQPIMGGIDNAAMMNLLQDQLNQVLGGKTGNR
ncbi:MAG: TlpA family protein disulfide reductase [Firmicutes bacterium]|nr:TlpA family protein disulfide reductase [Bacillota bacterium]